MATLRQNQDKINNYLVDNIDNTEKEISKQYKESNEEIKDIALEVYRKYDLPVKDETGKVSGELTFQEMSKTAQRNGEKKKRIDILYDLITAIYLKQLLFSDNYTKKRTNEHYEKTFWMSAWAVEQEIKYNMAYRITDKMISDAFNSPLSKLANSKLLQTDRSKKLLQIEDLFKSAFMQGSSYRQLAIQLDQVFGFRNSEGEKVSRALGHAWKSMQVARTEGTRIQSTAWYDQFYETQNMGIDTKMKLIAVKDTRTRAQSAQMDGQISNKEDGKFRYPNGNYYIPHNTGYAKWDINDRELVIQIIDGFEPKFERVRGEGIVEAQTYKEWAKKKGLKKNIYGQVLF